LSSKLILNSWEKIINENLSRSEFIMTRKTKKGIIGKARITAKKRPDIGPGIGFQELGLTTGEEIAEAIEKYYYKPEKE
jgi:hypothetical protein